MTRFHRLDGFEFVDCMVRSRDILGFVAQKFETSDPLEQRETAAFFFYPNKPPERQWAYAGIGDTTGMSACAVTRPKERWVFVLDDGAVFVSGGGAAGFENDIKRQPHSYFSRVRMLPSGEACAVGSNRKAYLRRDIDSWDRLADGLEESGETSELDARGFLDVAGFASGPIYACGGRGDLWRLKDGLWSRLSVPTSATLRRVLCASDGLVYVVTDEGTVIVGRDDTWSIIHQELTDERLENIVEYRDRVLVSTRSNLLEISSGRFTKANLGEPPLSGKSRIASGDDLLLLAGTQDAAFFDGTRWTVILEPLAGL